MKNRKSAASWKDGIILKRKRSQPDLPEQKYPAKDYDRK
jgi:hypothetical protein